MSFQEFVTYSFTKNVGRTDRALRIITGLSLTAVGWLLGASVWTSLLVTVAGVAWTLTGVVSRCGIYYLLGFSTCSAITGEQAKSERA